MRLPALVLGLTIATASASAAPAPWVEVKSAHFTVVTDAGDKAGLNIRERGRGTSMRCAPGLQPVMPPSSNLAMWG